MNVQIVTSKESKGQGYQAKWSCMSVCVCLGFSLWRVRRAARVRVAIKFLYEQVVHCLRVVKVD